FDELIGSDHRQRDRQPAPAARLPCSDAVLHPVDQAGFFPIGSAHMNLRFSPGPSMLVTQRAQISGCFGSDPTSGRRCQQRTHFGSAVGFTAIQTPPRPELVAGAASGGGAPSTRWTRAWDVMKKKRSSSPRALK